MHCGACSVHASTNMCARMQANRQTTWTGVDVDGLWPQANVVRATVRRAAMFKDGFEEMHHLGSRALKGRLQLQFINEHGETEAGVDGGGLFKDFMEHLLQARCWPLFISSMHASPCPSVHVPQMQPDRSHTRAPRNRLQAALQLQIHDSKANLDHLVLI